jgi:hypothetical protein
MRRGDREALEKPLGDIVTALHFDLLRKLHAQYPESEPSGEIPVIRTLRWEEVTLPETVSEADVDQIIFSMLRSQWQKTAMVVGRSQQLCRERSLPITAEIFGARILAPADSDSLEARGDPRKWRHSEVRLKR